MAGDFCLTMAGQTLRLLPERCLFWEETGILLLADLHLGKAAHLRHHGLPVPDGNTADDLMRLSSVTRRTGAREIIICGDFFHAPAAQSRTVLNLVEAWRQSHSGVAVSLVVGNHDRGPALPPAACGITVAGPQLVRGPLHLVHDPADASPDVANFLTISGHLHPCAVLPGGGAGMKAPCFWWQASRNCLVLPGFGSFTAGVGIHPEETDTVHAICNTAVTSLPVQLLRPQRRRFLSRRS